jgi:serine/threonine protein kinase/tetratricopeptide (TPR) repeat protein
MTPEQWRQVKGLLASVLEQPPNDRRAYLLRVCAEPDLRNEVESLIAAHGDSATTIFGRTQSMMHSAPSLQPGALLGPYRIEGRIGAGGMGEVFRATDTRLYRTVAIKLLPQGRTSDPAHEQRLLKEARAASALNHPNIVSIHDISSHEGTDFLVMEFVEGRTLKELMETKAMLLGDVLEFATQIASAMDAAHSAGVVHRDIKPANIMVTASRQIKVLDFGLAKMTEAYLHQQMRTPIDVTEVGMIVGTIAYMSPEQTRGEAVDARSDIFSFGCVLYEIATGALPFAGPSSLAIMHEIATAVPPPPSKVRPGLPAAFDQLVAKCLEKEPARRFARASEVCQAIKSLTLQPAAISVPTGGRRTVAVVPLQFRNAASEDRFLSVALADAIANRLGSAPTLVVRPIASLMKYAGKKTDWTQIAQELNVDLVVEGSIQKMGSRVRVLIQVWEFRNEQALHSAKLDGDMGSLFSLQDQLGDSVFGSLVPRSRERPTRSGQIAVPTTRHPLAFELYMRAVDRAISFNKFELSAAIEMLGRAVDLDPDFADAWGMLSIVCYHMGAHLDPDPKWFERAERSIARTLELDPVNCDALCARGMIHWSPSRGFQFRPALRALNAALKINPSRYTARNHRGALLFHFGFHEAAIVDAEESIVANPQSALSYTGRAFTALYMGDYAQASEFGEQALALESSLVHANIFSPLPSIYAGNLKTAREKLKVARQMIPEEQQIACMEGMILAHEGDFKRAEELTDDAVASKRSMVHTHHSWHCAAGVYAMCGKPEKAVAELKRCAEGGLPNYRAFEKDPHLRSLHSHPEFIELMRNLRHDYEAFRKDFELTDAPAAT